MRTRGLKTLPFWGICCKTKTLEGFLGAMNHSLSVLEGIGFPFKGIYFEVSLGEKAHGIILVDPRNLRKYLFNRLLQYLAQFFYSFLNGYRFNGKEMYQTLS